MRLPLSQTCDSSAPVWKNTVLASAERMVATPTNRLASPALDFRDTAPPWSRKSSSQVSSGFLALAGGSDSGRDRLFHEASGRKAEVVSSLTVSFAPNSLSFQLAITPGTASGCARSGT